MTKKGDRQYYLTRDGSAATGKVTISGIEYEFDSKGKLVQDKWDIKTEAVAFLRAVKALSVKKIEQADFMNTLDNPDFFYRHTFSRAIKDAYYKYIRAELTLQRKDFHSALALDSTISGKDGDETEQYALIPSKDMPIPILAESSWNLDTLYKLFTCRCI